MLFRSVSQSRYCGSVVFSLLFTGFLFPNDEYGFIFGFDVSTILKAVFPGFASMVSLILSIFSSGIASNVVLFMVCMAFIYQVSPAGILFVIIFIVSPSTPLAPMSPGASISLCPVGEFFDTLICISFAFIVTGKQ